MLRYVMPYMLYDMLCYEMYEESSKDHAQIHALTFLEHCDVLSMQMDSDLVIYRTTLVRTFQVVTICRVDKSESTRCILGKWVYLVTHAMSVFDLQDVCMVIGSLATLDLPMVVYLIGIYVLKGPYCTLTMTDWFLQALSVIPRGSWGDVVRRFTMIRWVYRQRDRDFIRGPDSENDNRQPLKCQFPREIGRSQASRCQQACGASMRAACGRGCAPVAHAPAHAGRWALRPLAGTSARTSRTGLRDTNLNKIGEEIFVKGRCRQKVKRRKQKSDLVLIGEVCSNTVKISCETLAAVDSSIRSTTGRETPSSACTIRPDEISTDGFSSKSWPKQLRRGAATAARGGHGGGGGLERREAAKVC
ncbi:hypothetical protein F511_14886 [Dorcoceras hygrometricum]|uniref:Uncharacterized protein n=1 Tax=Dorcoceras hygrometricum TaxID=472368 RepID=A0A2Z7BY82_9LAMI|nr:hypothetical protein F511_14886 [Dorcoceras hygrometricum]